MRTTVSTLRVLAALAVMVGAGWAIERFSLAPLRCARAASAGAAGLETISARNDHTRLRSARAIAATLADCDCMTSSRSRMLAVRAAAFNMAGDRQAAIATYQSILATDRRPEIYFSLAQSQLAVPDRAAALDSFERACAFDPARLRRIPYEELRDEVERRLIAKYGERWVR